MDRFQNTKKASLFGLLGNFFLLIIKFLIGLTCRSQAMIADAANSLGDIFASCMTFIGNKIASEPSDETHNFGHGKAEYLFSLFISISMMLFSTKIFYDSVKSLILQDKFTFSWLLLLVCIITIIVKLFLFFYTRKLYKEYGHLLLKSNMLDHRNDCILTLFTLVSILLSFTGIYWFDGVVGIGISSWIFYSGIKIFIESFNVLMDMSIDSNTQEIILDLVHADSNIKKVDKIYSSPIGDQYIITLTIYVDGNISTFESHKIADALEKNIEAIDKISKAIIHVNPI